MSRPMPRINTDSARFWAACREGRFLIQHCPACGHAQWYPRAVCTHCGRLDPEDVASAGQGVVESYTTVHRAPSPEFREDTPYVLALVRLDEGPRVLSVIKDADHGVNIGDRVEVTFAEGLEAALPYFRRTGLQGPEGGPVRPPAQR